MPSPSNPYFDKTISLDLTTGSYYSGTYHDLRVPYGTPTVEMALTGVQVYGTCEYVIPPLEAGNAVDTFVSSSFDNVWKTTNDGKYNYKMSASWVESGGYYDITITVQLKRLSSSTADSTTYLSTRAYKSYSGLILSYSTTETGSAGAPLIVGDSGITIGTTYFSAKVQDYYGNETDVTSSVIWAKTTFTKAEAESYNGEPYNITITYEYNNQEVKNFLPVYLVPKTIVSLKINGKDETLNYYENETSPFVTPVFTLNAGETFLYELVYNDGSSEEIDPADIDNITYKKEPLESATALSAGDAISAATQTLYVRVELNDGTYAYGAYTIYRKEDTVYSLATSSSFTFVLGNKYEKYKGNSLQVTATYNNPMRAADTNFVGYTFDSDSIVMSGTNGTQSISVHVGASSFTLTPSVTFTKPDISAVEIVNGTGIKSSYQNELDKIDISAVTLLVRYEDAEYTHLISFSSSDPQVVDADYYSVDIYNENTQVLNDVDYINGNTALDLPSTQAIYHCEFRFNIYNEFEADDDVELTIPFSVISLTEILGLKVVNPYTDYKVGEKFLNEKDTTQVVIFYKDVDGLGTEFINSVSVNLKQDIPVISTNYAKGTEWTQPDSSKRIVVSSVFDTNIYAEYTIKVEYDGYVSGKKTNNLVVIWQPYVTYISKKMYDLIPDILKKLYRHEEDNGVLAIYKEEDTQIDGNGIRSLKNAETAVPQGYIGNIFNTSPFDAQANMVLFKDYVPPIEGSSNITILYPYYTGLADNINKCQFGILFGNNNANNRLFISGNPNTPNADWHSGETNTIHTDGEPQKTNGDFSYFPAENIMFYGETDNKVIGYDIVSNDKLLVLKDKSDKEKTVYFRTPTLVTSLDASGNSMVDVQGNTMYQEEFSLVKGNNSVAGINPHAIVNLNGDTLFIDADNTVEGLDLVGIIGDNQRYANSRSIYLDNYLKDLDLSKSFLWTNNKYLFFPVEDVGLFVTHIDAKSNETNQYEWFLIQSENPTAFIEIDNVIYFGDGKGDLYQMRNGEYRDEYKVFVNEGQGVLAHVNDSSVSEIINGVTIPAESIVLNQDLFEQLFPADKPYYDADGKQIRHLYFRSVNEKTNYSGAIFYQIGYISNDDEATDVDLLIVEDNGVYYLEVVAIVNGSYNSERQDVLEQLLKENQDYYLNYTKESGIQQVQCDPTSKFYNNYNNRFRLEYVGGYERDRYLMKIYNPLTKEWDDIGLEALYRANLVSMADGEYEVCNVDEDTYSFQLKNDAGELMNITLYGNQGIATSFAAEIIERRNVSAYYVTAPFTMGNLNYFKTIWQFTLTNDTGKPSAYDLAVASNKIPFVDTKTIASISKAQIGTNFTDFTFLAVDFDKDVVPRTYTVQRTMGMQKFVCFAFKNDDNSNAILSSMSVIYTIPFPSYGSN